jgi:nudix-type nucleoside diphosphatase (YffH/AdpP family)
MPRVEIQEQQIAFQKQRFQIQEAKLRFEKFNGQMSETLTRLVFERGDAAAALIYNRDSQKVLFIKQFRYPTYEKGPGWLQEVVAGVIEKDETPEQCIRREVQEEIGYQVHDLTPIATFYVSPGGTSERILLFYTEVVNADRVGQGGGLVVEHEDIELVEVALPELWQALQQGTIIDAKTLIAVQWLQMNKGQ